MRFKFYLRGCGFGILIATIVLAVWFSTHKTVMTDDDVVARAEELGMVFEDDNAIVADTESQDETETEESREDSDDGTQAASVQDADDAENDEADAEEIAQESTGIEDSDGEDEAEPDENADENSSEDEEEEAEAADENAGDGEVTVISFTISGGQYARTISENLYEAGLVDDAEEFRLFMQANNYDNNIQVGTYELSTDMSYEDIAKIITTKIR